MKTLVIGYGNTLRGDDGVGPMVAKQVASWDLPNVRSRIVHQLTPELAEALSQVDMACFVDAVVQDLGVAPGTGKMLRLGPHPSTLQLDHVWSPHWLLHLTKTLYDVEPLAFQLLIPAVQFDYGETLSPEAISGVYWAVQTIKSLVEQKKVCYA